MLHSRYRRITFFFARMLLSVAFWDILLPHLGLRAWAVRNRKARFQRSAAQFREMAIQMGGVLIKVGQFMSSRVDVLPPEITSELAGLQDEVPPERYEDIRQVAEAEFRMTLGEKYEDFDEQPLAAASLGQVHQAKVRIKEASEGGEGDSSLLKVVVKIQRPTIQKIIATDMAALKTVGMWLNRYKPIRKRANVPALLAEFGRTLNEEIDYLAEGRNAETFAENFKDRKDVLVPKVIWSHTTQRVLTLEDVQAIKITDYESITSAGIDRAEVAKRLLGTYLKQIFEDGFFHADPHPGNLFVRPLSESSGVLGGQVEWQLTFIDFGMVGHVNPQARQGMRELLVGVGTRDAARMVKGYQMLGMLLPGADVDLIEQAEAAMFERFWGKNMTEMAQIDMAEMRDFAYQFRDLLYDLPFQVPQDIIFLGRTVMILSGMCTGLDPDFNVWENLAPFSKKMLTEELTSSGGKWFEELRVIATKLLNLPLRLDAMLGKLERGQLVVKDPIQTEYIKRLEISISRLVEAVIFAALLISSILMYVAREYILAGALGFIALLALIRNVFRRP